MTRLERRQVVGDEVDSTNPVGAVSRPVQAEARPNRGVEGGPDPAIGDEQDRLGDPDARGLARGGKTDEVAPQGP